MAIKSAVLRLKTILNKYPNHDERLDAALLAFLRSADGENSAKTIEGLELLEGVLRNVSPKNRSASTERTSKNIMDFQPCDPNTAFNLVQKGLISVYNKILHHQQNYEKVRNDLYAIYTYNKNNLNCVVNNATDDQSEWFEAVSHDSHPGMHGNAYLDFNRGFLLEGMLVDAVDDEGTKNHLTDLINDLINRAIENKGYEANTQLLLLDWLESFGGQYINGFLSKAFHLQHFGEEELVCASVEMLDNVWFLSEQNKISILLDTNFKSFLSYHYDSCTHLYRTAEKPADFREMSDQNSDILPLMRMKAMIELRIDKKEDGSLFVRPCVTDWHAYSYTPYFKPRLKDYYQYQIVNPNCRDEKNKTASFKENNLDSNVSLHRVHCAKFAHTEGPPEEKHLFNNYIKNTIF